MRSSMQSRIENYTELRTRLAFESDEKYREFTMRGIPSERPFVGVRIPIVRRIVDLIPEDCYGEFLKEKPVAIEEVLARGMIICKLPYEKMLVEFDSQIEYIDDWCTCDIFCSGLRKVIRRRKAEFLDLKVEGLLKSNDEFATRVGLVILKSSYVEPDYLEVIFDRVEGLREREEYYVRMAIAWLVAECLIKFPEETFAYLKVSRLPKWTYNKTISKICDSYRVDSEMKDALRKMRR